MLGLKFSVRVMLVIWSGYPLAVSEGEGVTLGFMAMVWFRIMARVKCKVSIWLHLELM